MYTNNFICLKQTIHIPCKLFVQKFFMITLPSYFLLFVTDCLYNIISIELLISNILISFDHSLCNLKHITFLFIPPYNISKSFPFCFTFISAFSASRKFSLLVFPCFYFLHSFLFSLTQLLISSFHYHASLCPARPFAHPQVLPVASSKTLFKTLQYPSTEPSFLLFALYLLTYDLKSLFTLSSLSLYLSPGYKLSPGVFYFPYLKITYQYQ